MSPTDVRLERLAAIARTATATLAVAVVAFLALKIPLLATFRAALVVLAAFELLTFGRRALSSRVQTAAYVEIAVKLVVLAAAYAVLST